MKASDRKTGVIMMAVATLALLFQVSVLLRTAAGFDECCTRHCSPPTYCCVGQVCCNTEACGPCQAMGFEEQGGELQFHCDWGPGGCSETWSTPICPGGNYEWVE